MLTSRYLSQIEKYMKTKSKVIEKDISCKLKENKARVAVLISDKIDFKTKAIVGDKERHYIMINE